MLSNLGLSPPAVSAPAAVRLLCSLDRAERGGTDPCREGGGCWWCWCWRGSRFCACRSVRGSRSQVERRASAGDAGSSQSGDRSPKMAHRCGATRLGRTRGENSLNAVRVFLWCVLICKHVTCATPDLPPSPLPPPLPPPSPPPPPPPRLSALRRTRASSLSCSLRSETGKNRHSLTEPSLRRRTPGDALGCAIVTASSSSCSSDRARLDALHAAGS